MPDESVRVHGRLEAGDRERHIDGIQNWIDPERWTPAIDRIPTRLDVFVPNNTDLLIDGISYSVTFEAGQDSAPLRWVIGKSYTAVEQALESPWLGNDPSRFERQELRSRLLVNSSHAGSDGEVVNDHEETRFQEPVRWRQEAFLYFGYRTNDRNHGGADVEATVHYRRDD